MKLYFTIPLTLFTLLLFTSCEESFISPNQDHTELAAKGGKKGKKLTPPDEDTPLEPAEPTPTDLTGTTYQLTTSPSDPLYAFIVDEEQQLILLRATEEFGLWGIDYYGYWADPFSFADQQVYLKSGLAETTYRFEFISSATVQVTKHLIVRSEFSYDVITRDETTNVGTFEVVN